MKEGTGVGGGGTSGTKGMERLEVMPWIMFIGEGMVGWR
jgi:hypothetical protein